MGLKDIIESAHGPDNIVGLLDKFLQERERKEEPRTGWHPSGFCGMCPRSHVIKKLIPPDKEEHEPELLRIFDTGHAHHYWYQNEYFGPMGILWGPWACRKCSTIEWGFKPSQCPLCKGEDHLYEEVSVFARLPDCTQPVNGRADGLIYLRGKWYVLEIKTINSMAFKWLREAREVHVKQAQIYCELIRQGHVAGVPFGVKVPVPEGIIFLYISKNDSVLKDFMVKADSDMGRAEMRNPILAERALASRELPVRLSVCTKKSDKRAQKCTERHRCFDKFGFEDLFLIGQNR